MHAKDKLTFANTSVN